MRWEIISHGYSGIIMDLGLAASEISAIATKAEAVRAAVSEAHG